ncbi:unnamed protein product [Bursaphelenchus xylophilus]|uniref:(pine wood nematode) hypothetical protein n=1 Tax=Bursaphelenchus xylophilus TaxID=6326 RepID=A0A1I7S1F6_BURXY|nr:unnamed protein product [Bursaphelenchus xylophilus]CAG9081581.1 unnamed protein product [Bursaphelenchus xylophilus]
MNGRLSIDDLPFLFRRQVVDLVTFNDPTFLFRLRLVSKKWNYLVQTVLQHRSWTIQKRRLDFGLLKDMPTIPTTSKTLKGLATLVQEDEERYLPEPSSPYSWLNNPDYTSLREFLERPDPRVEKNVFFLHGTSGNGTTFLLKAIARQYSKDYHVVYMPATALSIAPDRNRLLSVFKEALSNTPCILIIDDADKLIFEYKSMNADEWFLQKGKFADLLTSVQKIKQLRIILTSNELTLFRTEFHQFLVNVQHIPFKPHKERLYILRKFTADLAFEEAIRVESLVKRLNGHVVKALYCVCRRAASLAIMRGSKTIWDEDIDQAIKYVSGTR